MTKTIRQLCIVTVAGLGFALPLQAQAPAALISPRPVSLVLKEKFARNSVGAVVRREAGPSGRDIIAIRRSELTPETLVYALDAIGQSRLRDGENPSTQITVALLPLPKGRKLTGPENAEARITIAELTSRVPEEVRGVGRVAQVTLPASRVPKH